MIEPDQDLPEGFASDTHRDGRVTLRRHGVIAGEFPMLTPRAVIGSWASAYEAGHVQGEKTGFAQGRSQLAGELRNLLQIEGGHHAAA
ncbi:hypothetical protein ACELLULO517_21880 [Acidisoma cellulosilytica]|uniref:Uncharacterized protein n=1 Tax=Acidisoma cellulosilyticum TaxID=2802395 RepID=A0A963Z6S4_9PROT|nr:hypothetical protein [Acidisoma cellulosilyticum]MCB8882912.1 hypothetical protein [Acidisoma cellulosilyticum]